MTQHKEVTPEASRILDLLSSLSPEELKQVTQQSLARAETTVLRANLPAFLQPHAESISVREPTSTTNLYRTLFGDLCCDSGFRYDGSRTLFCISSRGEQEGSEHLLEVHCEWWNAESIGVSVDGEKTAVSLKYGTKAEWIAGSQRSAEGQVSSFDNQCGISASAYSAKGLKDLLKDVVGDMGFKGDLQSGEMFLDIIVALVGTKGEAFLGKKAAHMQTMTTYTPLLSEVIRDNLEGESESDFASGGW